jgi:hypothetical protein
MSDQLRVNGLQIGWASAKLAIDGETFHGVTSIGYADSLEVAKAYGMGRHHSPRGRSIGKYSTEPLTMTMWKSSAQELRRLLAEKSGQQGGSSSSYGRAVVPIVLQYIEPDDATITVEFEDCRYVKATASNEEGAEALKEDVEFDVMRIRRNGLTLFEEAAQ